MKILLLAGNTLRARSYSQYLASFFNNSDVIIEGLFFGFNERKCSNPIIDVETESFFQQENLFIPDLSQSIKNTFDNHNWNYSEIETYDVNSKEILDKINEFNSDIIVFAGYGGQILKQQHFDTGKKYLHMHPGKLPIERGSTTVYYSILNNRNCSVTAFYMSAKIDDGVNLLIKEYKVPFNGVNIDLWYDNIIRADCFVNAIKTLLNNNVDTNTESERPEEYYVIHPILKHVALMSLKKI